MSIVRETSANVQGASLKAVVQRSGCFSLPDLKLSHEKGNLNMSNVEYVTTRRTTVTKRVAPKPTPAAITHNLDEIKREQWREQKQAQRARRAQTRKIDAPAKPAPTSLPDSNASDKAASFFNLSVYSDGPLWSFSGELPAHVVLQMMALYQDYMRN